MEKAILLLFQAITETFLGLGDYLKKRLDEQCRQNSKRVRLYFLEYFVSLNLDASIFNVIYVGKVNRKPKDPKLIFRILVAKEILLMSDQEILDELKDNRQLRELFGIVTDEQIPCRKTLTRFRNRLEKHHRRTGENLMEKIINSLIQAISFTTSDGVGQVIYRIDSTPIEAFLKEKNRMELFYTTIAAFVNGLVKKKEKIPESLEHYTNKSEYNQWFYHKRDKKAKEIYWSILLEDIQTILFMDSNLKGKSPYYSVFMRLVGEQTVFKGKELTLKEKISSDSLQSPFDPDATYRFKNGKGHVGYVINFVEMIFKDENSKIIARHLVYYQVEPNIYSDAAFLEDFIESCAKLKAPHKLVCDGAYFSGKNEKLALKKNLILVPTELTGRKTDPFFKDFKLSEDGRKFLSCPGGKTPRRATYNEKNENIRLSFNKKDCMDCPHREKCKPTLKKRVAVRTISKKQVHRAEIIGWMDSEEYSELSRVRNGVESIPSQLKNTYSINKIRRRNLFNTDMNGGLKFLSLAISKLADTWIRICFPEINLV